MYLAHFGLRAPPFDGAPAVDFVFPGGGRLEGMARLRAALGGGAGLGAIVGEAGTGKTLLCRDFLAGLGPKWRTACISDPRREPRAFMQAVAAAFGAGAGAPEIAPVIGRLGRRLLESVQADGGAVLCIDDAQALPRLTLDSLRLLSNLENGGRRLLHIVLFGRPELDATLAARPLGERITFRHRLRRLDADEVAAYVAQRLRAAGHEGSAPFTPAAQKALHYCSGGTPRVVDALADKALRAACDEGRLQADTRQVRAAARGTQGAIHHFWWPW